MLKYYNLITNYLLRLGSDVSLFFALVVLLLFFVVLTALFELLLRSLELAFAGF